MAKTSRPNPRRESTFEGLDQDDLRHELGFDDLTYETCFRELFGDLFELAPKRDAGPARVTQMGPGHRSRAKPDPDTEVEPEEM